MTWGVCVEVWEEGIASGIDVDWFGNDKKAMRLCRVVFVNIFLKLLSSLSLSDIYACLSEELRHRSRRERDLWKRFLFNCCS